MYISFVGLSGAGKTTTAKGVRKILEEAGYRCDFYYEPFFKPRRKFWYKAAWAIYLWRFFDKNLFLTIYWYKFKYYLKVGVFHHPINIYTALKVKYYLERMEKQKTDVVIFDQDFLLFSSQCIADGLMNENKVVETVAESILSKSNVMLQVLVNTPSNLAAERFCKREKKEGLEKKITEKKKRDAYNFSIMQTVDAVDKLDDVHTVVVDGTNPPGENIEKVAEKALELLAQKAEDDLKMLDAQG